MLERIDEEESITLTGKVPQRHFHLDHQTFRHQVRQYYHRKSGWKGSLKLSDSIFPKIPENLKMLKMEENRIWSL